MSPARKRSAAKARSARGAARPGSQLRAHLAGRLDPLTDAVLTFPLFLAYQLGVLLSGHGTSGVDFITRGLALLSQRDPGIYLLLLAGLLAGYAGLVSWLRRSGSFDLRRFVPMLLESALYAGIMGTVILFVMQRFVELLPQLAVAGAGPALLEIFVVSAGAGLHEELLFRLVGLGGLALLFRSFAGPRSAWLLALVLSSLLFAGAHHIGADGEPFTTVAFAYRSLAGLYFALLFVLRGFAVAAWTHTLYDVYVMSFGAT